MYEMEGGRAKKERDRERERESFKIVRGGREGVGKRVRGECETSNSSIMFASYFSFLSLFSMKRNKGTGRVFD